MEHTSVERVPTIRPRVLVAATAACAVLSGLVWHSSGAAGWEQPAIALLRREQLPMGRSFLLLWAPLPFGIGVLCLAWTALTSKRALLALSGTVGCVVATTVTEAVLKPLVGRHHVHGGSAVFPSGHVTAAAAWAMFAWLVIGHSSRLRSVVALVPVMAGWAVISIGVHYPADAVAGLLLGGLVVYSVVLGADRVTTTLARRGRESRATEVLVDRPIADDRTAVAA